MPLPTLLSPASDALLTIQVAAACADGGAASARSSTPIAKPTVTLLAAIYFTARHVENSDVLPPGPVAVDVANHPGWAPAAGTVRLKDAFPAALVVTDA